MPRLLLVLFAVALTVFAVADWATRSRYRTPGNVNRWIWLAVILLLPIIGPAAWIITGLVTRAEARHLDATATEDTKNSDLPPDDNPEAISDVAKRIARRKKRTKPEPPPRQDHPEDDSEDEEI